MSHAHSRPLPLPGQLLRTQELRQWSSNPNRLAREWEKQGILQPYGSGMWLYVGVEGLSPSAPSLEQWVQARLGNEHFVVTGPDRWNRLELDIKFSPAKRVVYNRKRTGIALFGDEEIALLRRRFPVEPSKEWFALDMLMHGRWDESIEIRIWSALKSSRLDRVRFLEAAKEYGNQTTRDRIRILIDSIADPTRRGHIGTIIIPLNNANPALRGSSKAAPYIWVAPKL